MPAPEIDRLFRLDGRVAIVTGASRGLGERFARVLRAAGRRGDRRRPRRARRWSACRAETGATVEAGDVRDDAHLERLVQHALSATGASTSPCPTRASPRSRRSRSSDLAKLRDLLAINLHLRPGARPAGGPAMLAQGGGSIVNVASILGLVAPGDTAMAGYTAAKAA